MRGSLLLALSILAGIQAQVPTRKPQVLGGDEPEYSFSAGAGQFYAIRHNRPGEKPYIEVIGSGIALRRAHNQAREGNYTLDIKGPFEGHREASAYIREAWDPAFGRPRKAVYERSPAEPQR